jgi:hypothetical protein
MRERNSQSLDVRLASNPPVIGSGNSMGKFEKLAKFLGAKIDNADDVLRAVDNPELAVSLKGPERAEYLSALDESFGDRSKRAADMGFGKRKWFHGTTVDIPEFKSEAKGLSTGAQSAKKGFFFASDPSTASDYAELARERGVIREGDNVTTRFLSETADDHNDLYDQIKDLDFERQWRSSNISKQKERLLNTKSILKSEMENPRVPERIADLKNKIEQGENFILQQQKEMDDFAKKIRVLNDVAGSQGQQVGAYRLRGDPSNIHVKNYNGQGYRDTSYADEMAKAQEQGKAGVLFRKTYDPADPNNRVKQDIAAVFEPDQVRSVNAAFDPRFKKSPLVLAGAGATTTGEKMDPLQYLSGAASLYKTALGKAHEKLANEMDLTKDKSAKDDLKSAMGLVLDPVNLIPGAAGLGAGAMQMLGEEKKDWSSIRDYLK